MLDDKDGRKPDPALRDLTTEELERLLCEDFEAGGESDPAYIMAILEVIQEREAAGPGGREIDVDAAWKDFQENYQGQADAYEAIDSATPSNHLDQIRPTAKPRGKFRISRVAALVAIGILLLSAAASAFGQNWINAFIHRDWETFGFETAEERMNGDGETVSANDVLGKLQAVVAGKTSVAVVPTWAPDGTEQNGDIRVDEHIDGPKVLGTYTTELGEFIILIRIYDELPESYKANYQMNQNGTQTAYEAGGVIHYLAENKENNVATWHNEKVEVHIQGSLTMDDLKKMIDSIYEE